MASYSNVDVTGGVTPPATVRVWDPFIRIFHWSVVALFAIAFLSADEIEGLHLWAGYAITALVGLRIVWGFVGPRHARFSDFVRGPTAIWSYVKNAMHLDAPRTLGHNPAGGAMIIALLVMLVGLSATGILMTTDMYWGSKALEEIHEALAYSTLFLVGLHIVGVIFASVEQGENLVKSMVTGKKRALEDEHQSNT